jgi:dihydrolipoamide dehydrogenase
MVVGEMPESRDLVIIGGGPGGIEAAQVGAAAGHTVTVIDDGDCLGGALPSLRDETSALRSRLVANGIEVLLGTAAFTAPQTIRVVRQNQGAAYLEFESCIIATGAEWRQPSTAAALPAARDGREPVVVAGSGIVALMAVAQLHRRGIRTELAADPQQPSELHRAALLTVLGQLAENGPLISGVADPASGTGRISLSRRPRTAGLDLARAGVELDVDGGVSVGPDLLASTRIAAIGDVVAGPASAQRAVSQARVAVAALDGQAVAWDALVPVHLQLDLGDTTLEAASIGVDSASPGAGDTRVLAASWQAEHRLVYDAATRILLGASSVGPGAGSFIAGLAPSIEAGLTVDDVTQSVLPHPLTAFTIDRPWAEGEPT